MPDYTTIASQLLEEPGVEQSTMMKSPCLRYRGEFMAMMFDKADSLIVKLAAEQVDELIAAGKGEAFDFTGKRFKQWLMVPRRLESSFADRMNEALEYARQASN